MSNNIDGIVIPILRQMQGDLSAVKSDVAVLKQMTGKIDIRLKIVESHMSGFMSSTKFLEAEVDELRGRAEALEQRDHTPSPAE